MTDPARAADLLRWLRHIRVVPSPEGLRLPGFCWIWTGGRSAKGYGRFYTQAGMPSIDGRPRRDGGRVGAMVLAHRFGLWVLRGEPCLRLHADHLCRRPPCVNPWHGAPLGVSENTAKGNYDRAEPLPAWSDPFEFLEINA